MISAIALQLAAQSRTAQAVPLSADTLEHARALLRQMTVDEKVGQLTQAAGIPIPGLSSEKSDDLIAQGKAGSILWLTDVKEINRLQRIVVEKSRLHIPPIVGFDVIHGYRTVFPVPLAMASSWDPSVEEQFWSPQTKTWVVGPSVFDIWAGEDSTATLHADLTVTR